MRVGRADRAGCLEPWYRMITTRDTRVYPACQLSFPRRLVYRFGVKRTNHPKRANPYVVRIENDALELLRATSKHLRVTQSDIISELVPWFAMQQPAVQRAILDSVDGPISRGSMIVPLPRVTRAAFDVLRDRVMFEVWLHDVSGPLRQEPEFAALQPAAISSIESLLRLVGATDLSTGAAISLLTSTLPDSPEVDSVAAAALLYARDRFPLPPHNRGWEPPDRAAQVMQCILDDELRHLTRQATLPPADLEAAGTVAAVRRERLLQAIGIEESRLPIGSLRNALGRVYAAFDAVPSPQGSSEAIAVSAGSKAGNDAQKRDLAGGERATEGRRTNKPKANSETQSRGRGAQG